MRHKLISLCLIAWLLLMMPMTVFAQEFGAGRTGSISVTLVGHNNGAPIKGAEFSLYQVVSVVPDEKGDPIDSFTDAFEEFELLSENTSFEMQLDNYIKEHSVAAEKEYLTDDYGRAVFGNLPLGIYYVKQTNYVEGYAPCNPFVVSIPERINGRDIYDIKANPKTEPAEFINITIKKVWDVDNVAKIPDHVEVELLRDGSVVKTAVLNETNNWKVTFSDMLKSDSYSVAEVNIPEGFTAAYTSREYVFTVTNKYSSESDNPGNPGKPSKPGTPGGPDESGDVPPPEEEEDSALVQTGQLVWPIPVLAMAGLCLIVVGTIVLRKTRDNNA